MRRNLVLAIFAALFASLPTATMNARGFGGFHGGGFHGGFHGFRGFGGLRGFGHVRSFHGAGFRGAHFGRMRFGYHHFGGRMGRHPGRAAALGFAAGAHGLAHVSHGAALHPRSDLRSLGHNRFAGNAFASRLAWNRWGGDWQNRRSIWFGSAFWPYLYGDLLSFIFWPYAYYDPLFAYGVDGIISGIFWPGLPLVPRAPYDVYGDGTYGYSRALPADGDVVVQACAGLAPGVADLPMDRVERAVRPIGNQLTLFGDLKSAASRANRVLKDSCPNGVPLTPVGRLDAIEQRFSAASQALKILQEPLGAFYESLATEQRQGFDAIAAPNRTRSNALGCDEQTSGFSSLPVERIEQTVRPTVQQMGLLDALQSAASKASVDLKKSCPAEVPGSIVDRLSVTESRLGAMLEAAKAVRPGLESFYASLDDEQKARFNAMGNPLRHAQRKL
jgi:hypothetical protein